MKEVMTKKDTKLFGLYFIPDQMLFVVWKYLNGRRFIQRDTLTFWDIAPHGRGIDEAIRFFLLALEILGIPLEGAIFYKKDY